ncbi:Glycosyltransferase, partial [hydrothermal vent metagenome]
SLERHRMMWLFLKNETPFFKKKLDVLHIAPEICFINRFEKLHKEKYITADIESPLAKIKLDVHDIPFEEGKFDVVFCNHVMEHVNDDKKAMSEIYRVLKPGGFAILQVPLFYPLLDVTYEDKSITSPTAREKAFGQSDHVRMYGKDYEGRLRSVGFIVDENRYFETLPKEEVKRYALPLDEPVFYCRKN